MASERLATRATVLGGKRIEYAVRVSPRARNVRLEISPEKGLLVVIPRRFDLTLLPGLLKTKECWIVQKLEKIVQIGAAPGGLTLRDAAPVPYQGGWLTLEIRTQAAGHGTVERRDGVLRVRLPRVEADLVRQAIEAWYRAEARRVITERVAILGLRFGVGCGKIYIKAQRARWGSCSSRRNLNFNWRLILAPPEILDYIVIHELTHLTEMNHSRRFWQLVAERCPPYRQLEAWLKEHGASLTL